MACRAGTHSFLPGGSANDRSGRLDRTAWRVGNDGNFRRGGGGGGLEGGRGKLLGITQGDGFVAALDQSGGSTPGALRLYGILETDYSGEAEMFALMHQMRVRIM